MRDQQYAFFHESIPLLSAAAIGFLTLSYAVRWISRNVSSTTQHNKWLTALSCAVLCCAVQSLRARLWFYALFSVGFLLFANGSSFGFMFIIVSINFAICMCVAACHALSCVPALIHVM